MGKSNDYILLKVPELKYCERFALFAPGAYLKFLSRDLVNNLKMGKELVKILLKKRLALRGRLSKEQRELDKHMEKVDALNTRYKVLRDKLEAEWRDELAAIEEDKGKTLKSYRDLELRVLDVENKLEKYRIEDSNFRLDRWALDPRLYYEK